MKLLADTSSQFRSGGGGGMQKSGYDGSQSAGGVGEITGWANSTLFEVGTGVEVGEGVGAAVCVTVGAVVNIGTAEGTVGEETGVRVCVGTGGGGVSVATRFDDGSTAGVCNAAGVGDEATKTSRPHAVRPRHSTAINDTKYRMVNRFYLRNRKGDTQRGG